MKTIGITGPTGAGKTALLREIEAMGGTVIDCDELYHGLLETDTVLQARLEAEFGRIRDGSGRIDRKKLAAAAFSGQERLDALNRIAWPAVTASVRKTVADARTEIVAIDAFALLESGLDGLCDTTIAVIAPVWTRVQRIIARDGLTQRQALDRIQSQKQNMFYAEYCRHILYNDCPTEALFAERARNLLRKIL